MKHECCQVEGCKNQGKLHRNGSRFFPRGFCSTHYKKFARENRDIIEADKIKPNCCSVDGCDKPKPYKKGLCDMHYQRLSNNGDVNLVQKRREGQTEHPLYNTYHGMRKRCLQETDKDYHRYGGRGIKICERWSGVDGFFNFIEDIGERPDGYTLDRKDTNGDYTPENCRWADINTQGLNKRNVKHRGVIFYQSLNKYRARITVDKISYELGMFKDLEEAIEVRKQAENKYLGRILDV